MVLVGVGSAVTAIVAPPAAAGATMIAGAAASTGMGNWVLLELV